MINLPKGGEELERVLSDMHSILNNRKFFMDWLKTECRRIETLNRTEPDVTRLRWRQGGIQLLSQLIAEIEKAKDTYTTVLKK